MTTRILSLCIVFATMGAAAQSPDEVPTTQLPLKLQDNEQLLEDMRGSLETQGLDPSRIGREQPRPVTGPLTVKPLTPVGPAPKPQPGGTPGTQPGTTSPVPVIKGRDFGGNCQGCPDVEQPPNVVNPALQYPVPGPQTQNNDDDDSVDCSLEENRSAPECLCERPADLTPGKGIAPGPCRPVPVRPTLQKSRIQ